jgi:hypothetical protein
MHSSHFLGYICDSSKQTIRVVWWQHTRIVMIKQGVWDDNRESMKITQEASWKHREDVTSWKVGWRHGKCEWQERELDEKIGNIIAIQGEWTAWWAWWQLWEHDCDNKNSMMSWWWICRHKRSSVLSRDHIICAYSSELLTEDWLMGPSI